jgi:LysR family transcriptional regulator, benzoate and cis,cis-muconate-responsive activator of ben and cat genes
LTVDIDKLKAFVVVAEELNFRRSADILGMSQPPLTRLIASLERELATRLFDRTTRSVELTAAGLLLLKEAREIVLRSENLARELRSVARTRAGKLHVGFSTTAFLACLPKVVDEFRSHFPKVILELQQESRRGILDGLRAAKFDACFLEGAVEASELERRPIKDEPLGILLPKGHRLAKKRELDLRELKEDVFILHPRREQQAPFDTVIKICEQNGFRPKAYIKSQHESCPVLVAIGKGVSLTVASSRSFVPNETRFVPVKRLYLPVSIYWTKDNSNPALKSFLSFVIENASLRPQKAECLVDVIRV